MLTDGRERLVYLLQLHELLKAGRYILFQVLGLALIVRTVVVRRHCSPLVFKIVFAWLNIFSFVRIRSFSSLKLSHDVVAKASNADVYVIFGWF